jgi:hypothetical protein
MIKLYVYLVQLHAITAFSICTSHSCPIRGAPIAPHEKLVRARIIATQIENLVGFA